MTLEELEIHFTRLTAENKRLVDKLDSNRCNSGHETLPLLLWDCPACTNLLREEIARLKAEVYRLTAAMKPS